MAYEITGHTKLTGLLGSPVVHSRSPVMHNEGFRQLGLDYVYLAFDVGTGTLGAAVEGLKALGARGWNVTMPNKKAMCLLADRLSLAAQISGSVNTIVNEEGILTGYTTDGIGFMRDIREMGQDILGKKITVLGTGGAALAIITQVALDGVSEIAVFNRRGLSYDQAEKMIGKLRKEVSCKIWLYDDHDPFVLKREIAESVMLVNATSVGMKPMVEQSIITDQSMFHKDLFVYDVIYDPAETCFMRLAKEAGCRAENGLGMLLYQGAEAFRLWTGYEMPIESIREKYFK